MHICFHVRCFESYVAIGNNRTLFPTSLRTYEIKTCFQAKLADINFPVVLAGGSVCTEGEERASEIKTMFERGRSQ